MEKIYFAKTNAESNAKIPIKGKEMDNGFDLYAHFEEEFITILPGETELIPTGIASSFDGMNLGALIKERGSTGIRGMAVRAGVVEGDYNGEIFVAINNTSSKMVIITKNIRKLPDGMEEEVTQYPYDKAIAQYVLYEKPALEQIEITYEELVAIESERGSSKLGASGH